MSFVYFAKLIAPNGPMGAVKIGYSSDPATRMLSISTNQPYKAELLGCFVGDRLDEALVHCWLKLKGSWISGEFFRHDSFVDELLSKIKDGSESLFPIRWEFLEPTACAKARTTAFKDWLEVLAVSKEEISKVTGLKISRMEKLDSGTSSDLVIAAALAVAASKGNENIVWPRLPVQSQPIVERDDGI